MARMRRRVALGAIPFFKSAHDVVPPHEAAGTRHTARSEIASFRRRALPVAQPVADVIAVTGAVDESAAGAAQLRCERVRRHRARASTKWNRHPAPLLLRVRG